MGPISVSALDMVAGAKLVLKRWSGTVAATKNDSGLSAQICFTTASLLLIYTNVCGRVRYNSPRVASSPYILFLPFCLHFPRS